MELFDFIKIIFEKPEEYKKLKPYEKAKFFFMTNRFMGIAYPIQAQMFNHIKIPQASTLDYWHRNLRNVYKSVPDWIYTKTKKTKADAKIDWPSEEAIQVYLTKNKASRRDLEQAVKMFGESTLDPIHKIDRLIKGGKE